MISVSAHGFDSHAYFDVSEIRGVFDMSADAQQQAMGAANINRAIATTDQAEALGTVEHNLKETLRQKLLQILRGDRPGEISKFLDELSPEQKKAALEAIEKLTHELQLELQGRGLGYIIADAIVSLRKDLSKAEPAPAFTMFG